MNGTEPGKLATAGFEDSKNFVAESGRADGIDQQLHRNSSPCFFGKSFGEASSDLAVPENVLLHGDGSSGGFNRLQHDGIKRIAIVVDGDAVAGHQRHTGDSFNG